MDRSYLVPTDYDPHYHDTHFPLSHYVSLLGRCQDLHLTKARDTGNHTMAMRIIPEQALRYVRRPPSFAV
jgi:hypothetical protein